ncbi:extracellular solute-binding protein [Actinomadura madurae]|uniref:Carbohydrate ABC transporter substrate-binding protein, CUT1 family n=1 Tax=Actinomadura madurae TaxID=1993 RepID=A0A1I5U800_9ACTN|nr:extracellular solute-binding protein [Actinomadura madurae]SFP91394.1 carbohydrate ABC transporter substrate-binding protein, CUT1 family [Actinomadura madurae]SPT51973.1 Probable ABC transporter-binding protein DR_1438 precursor [Actinomadura madurae]
MVERVGRAESDGPERARRRTRATGRHGPAGRLRAALALALVAGGLSACGGGGGAPKLTWYINPDNGGQAAIAKSCTQAAGGKYRIETSLLPSDATQQREQLIRRLAAKDSGLDLMSLDPVFVAEAANAGFLRPFTQSEAAPLTEGVFDTAVQSSTWEGKLYAAPFWANTQLLWYRKSVAQKAGIDPNAPDFTWDKLIDAAIRTNTTIGVQGNRYEGYMVWINALIASAGGRIISDAEKGDEATIDIDSPAGRQAASIIQKLARSSAASPTLSTDIEEQSRSTINGPRGGFLLNWGYVWRAEKGDAEAGAIDKNIVNDLGWARYPRVSPQQESKPPFGGIEIGVGAYGKHRDDLAVEAVRCITSPANMKRYMLDEGNVAARPAIFDDPDILKEFPMAPLMRDSIAAAAPRPATPYYADVSGAIQNRWHPPASVNPATTPGASAAFIREVLQGKALL